MRGEEDALTYADAIAALRKNSEEQNKKFQDAKNVNDLEEVTNELLDYLKKCKGEKYAAYDVIDSGAELLGEHSTVLNTWNMLKYLKRYRTKGFSKSGLRSDLLKIIHYALFELEATREK